jgi:LacI family transcriptional regulator
LAVTIREVALHAGVSVATVSRVLNDRPDVGRLIRSKVLRAVDELNYRPNNAARSLRTRATQVLGLIIADVTNPFFTAVARGVEDAAQQVGYSVLLANTDEKLAKESRYLDVAVTERLAGVVLAPASSTATDITALKQAGIPMVTIDRRLQGVTLVDSVTVNNFNAALDATLHLYEQGCKRVAFIGGPQSTTTGARRLAGYRAAVKQTGRTCENDLIGKGDWRVEGGRQAMRRLLDNTRFDGVLIANSPMTIGALEVLGDRGYEVPSGIAVVGFDEESWARSYRPPLTVVAQPTYEIGQRATQLLLERIAAPGVPARHLVLPATLQVRESSMHQRHLIRVAEEA